MKKSIWMICATATVLALQGCGGGDIRDLAQAVRNETAAAQATENSSTSSNQTPAPDSTNNMASNQQETKIPADNNVEDKKVSDTSPPPSMPNEAPDQYKDPVPAPVVDMNNLPRFTISTSDKSPAYQIAASGNEVVVGVTSLCAPDLALTPAMIGVELMSGSPQDINGGVSLWEGPVQIGTGYFVGNKAYADIIPTNAVTSIAQGTCHDITAKVIPSSIGVSQPGKEGSLIRVEVVASHTSARIDQAAWVIGATGSAPVEGVRFYKTIPKMATCPRNAQTLTNGYNTLLCLKGTASNMGDLGIAFMHFVIFAPSTVAVQNITLDVYTDTSKSRRIYSIPANALWLTTNGYGANVVPQMPITIPAAMTYYMELTAQVTGSGSGVAIATFLKDDPVHLPQESYMGTVNDIITADGNFIWSPYTFTAPVYDAVDWTADKVEGIPENGLGQILAN